MKRVKFVSKHKIILIFILLGFVFIGFFLFNSHKKIPLTIASALNKEKKIIYPTQYSDSHITENAIISDPKFKNITFFDKEDFLANAISVLQKNKYNQLTEGQENGTWLWTPPLRITPKYRDSIISDAKKNGIKNIYLSIDSYLDIFVMSAGPEKEAKKKDFTKVLEDFVKVAHENNMTVDAEAGWRNWAEEGNEYKAFAVLNYAMQFNKTHTEKLRGFQYDVEPYLLDDYQNKSETILYNYINLVDKTVGFMNKSDLELSVVIPEFYDGTSIDAPKFSYRGKTAYAVDHLLSVLDRRAGSKIILMSYRNFSLGEDGSIDISQDEINLANNYKTKIIVAQETGDVNPPYITFFGTSHKYYDKQLALIQKAFEKDESFGGLATHYVNVFLELK
jgi:hypothetical protein